MTDAGRDELTKTASLVTALATLYDILQAAPGGTEVEVNGIVEELCAIAGRTTGCAVDFSPGPPAHVDATQAHHLLIIVNELLTNGIKHASRKVIVKCDATANTACITVEDDGPGLPAGFDLARSKRFGLRMVRTLACKASGSVDVVSRAPAIFRVQWPRSRRSGHR